MALKKFIKSWSRIRDLTTKAWTMGIIGNLYALAELRKANLKENILASVPEKDPIQSNAFKTGFRSGRDILQGRRKVVSPDLDF